MKKKLTTLSLLLCLYLVSYGQTVQETLDYLKTYYSEIPSAMGPDIILTIRNNPMHPNIVLSFCKRWNKNSLECLNTEDEYLVIREITEIEIEHTDYKYISENERINEGWYLKIHFGGSKPIEISIDPKKERSYVEKLKKALMRLAILEGAKIVNEDMF